MASRNPVGVISRLSLRTDGVFRGTAAVDDGVTRKQLSTLVAREVIERVLPDTYRVTAVSRTSRQRLHAARLWAGPEAAAAGRSAGEPYFLEDIRAPEPEIVMPDTFRGRAEGVVIHRNHTPAR